MRMSAPPWTRVPGERLTVIRKFSKDSMASRGRYRATTLRPVRVHLSLVLGQSERSWTGANSMALFLACCSGGADGRVKRRARSLPSGDAGSRVSEPIRLLGRGLAYGELKYSKNELARHSRTKTSVSCRLLLHNSSISHGTLSLLNVPVLRNWLRCGERWGAGKRRRGRCVGSLERHFHDGRIPGARSCASLQ